MPHLEIYILGPPKIEIDGEPLRVDTRKAVALLAYLVLSPDIQRRDGLATLLWPEFDQTRARAALRRTLSALRKALNGAYLETDREAVSLTRDESLWVDVEQFRELLVAHQSHGHDEEAICHICLSNLTEAVELYRGDFMNGFTLRDSPSFDEWQFFETESLRRAFAGALEKMVQGHCERRQFEQAITFARRWLALDPLHEPAHRQLMRMYAWSGQQAAALRQYRECVRVLDEELGVPPLEKTTELYEAIRENRLAGPEHRVDRRSPIRIETAEQERERVGQAIPEGGAGQEPGWEERLSYPLVGRTHEWSVLTEIYEGSIRNGRVVALEGEAGIGKSRLAEDFLDHVRATGGAGMYARCYKGEASLAFGPIIDALRSALQTAGADSAVERVADNWLLEATRLLPELTEFRAGLGSPPPLEGVGAQGRFFEAVARMLHAFRGSSRPGLLVIDDLHWADEASLDFLTYLVWRLNRRPLCLLFTWRSELIPPDHRVRTLMAEAQREHVGRLLTLRRLDKADVDSLVQSSIAEPVTEAVKDRLFRETEGLPYFVVEYLKLIANDPAMLESGHLSPTGGVRNLLLSRLAALRESASQILTTAAVIGRSFDFDTLRVASGRSEEESVQAVEELLLQGLIEEVDERLEEGSLVYDFSHEQLRNLVYQQTNLARLRLLHRRVAEALRKRARGQDMVVARASKIAQHYQRAGEESQAAEFYKLAGDHARSLYANAEAQDHYRSALALGHRDTTEIHEALGDLYTLTGEYSAALTSYETAASFDGSAALARIEHKLGLVCHRMGDWDLAESHFQAASGVLEKTPSSERRARLLADWSLNVHRRRDLDRALNLADEALAFSEETGDTRALAQAHNVLGILRRSQEDMDAARGHFQRSLSYAEDLESPSAQAAAMNNLALLFGADGEMENALVLFEKALTLCNSLGDRHRAAALYNNLADLLHSAGRLEESMDNLKKAVAIFSEIGVEVGDWQPEIWKLVEW